MASRIFVHRTLLTQVAISGQLAMKSPGGLVIPTSRRGGIPFVFSFSQLAEIPPFGRNDEATS
jgi:hypothetical protein